MKEETVWTRKADGRVPLALACMPNQAACWSMFTVMSSIQMAQAMQHAQHVRHAEDRLPSLR